MFTGGWNMTEMWDKGGFWNKIDVLILFITRAYIIMLIISVILTVIVAILGISIISKAR